MFCKNCGAKLAEGESCYNCTSFTIEPASLSLALAITAVFLVVLNIIIVPFVHLVGVGLGIYCINRAGREAKFKRAYAGAAKVLGILAIILGIFSMLMGAVFVALGLR